MPRLARRGEKPGTPCPAWRGTYHKGLREGGCNMNDDLQRCSKDYEIDWELVQALAVMSIFDLCAYSVGLHPNYARLAMWVTTEDPEGIPNPEEHAAELAAYRNERVTKWERRVTVAVNHVRAGTLPVVENIAYFGRFVPHGELSHAEKIVVRVSAFVAWADGMGWELPPEFPRPGQDPVGRERLTHGGCPKWPWGDYETPLLRKLAAAVERFWKLYDPDDPTTAPTNQQVVEWLKEQGVSERTAEVIATILRADGLPPGPRK
jgi:hypothetical protein